MLHILSARLTSHGFWVTSSCS